MRPRSRSNLSWVMLAVGIAASIAVAFGAYTIAGYAWDQVVSYKSPYVREPGVAETSPTPIWIHPGLTPSSNSSAPVLANRVVLVIVDGMREDVSRSEMATLNRLRTYGADITLTVPQPSLSFPNWTTILSGAPQEISGVTTNWFEGRVPVPTIMDTAEQGGRRVAVVGPEDFSTLFGVRPGPSVSLRAWPKGGYLTSILIDDALRIAKASDPQLLVVHLPDLDEAGHSFGGASKEYRQVAHQIDIDIGRLVDGLQRDDTAFVIVADHGHIDSGGHGGWEKVATTVPGVFAGARIKLGAGTGRLEQVAPTVSLLSGLPDPAYAAARALPAVISTTNPDVYRSDDAHHVAFQQHYIDVVTAGNSTINSQQLQGASVEAADALAAEAKAERVSRERSYRALNALLAAGIAILVVAVVAVVSWRACVAALAGTAAYYVVYNALFFLVHRYNWSLSAFNTETHVKAFMNGRMIEAIVSALLAAAVAAGVYPLMRRQPKGPRDRYYLSGWLALGPATVLLIQATLAIQVANYFYWYGFKIDWILPNFMWAFKADLDLVQMTALAVAALLGPLVTYLVGRYHPLIARVGAGGGAAGSKISKAGAGREAVGSKT
jgi:hypothetical protein